MASLKLHGLGFSPSTARALACFAREGHRVRALSRQLRHPRAQATALPLPQRLNPFGQIPALQDGDITLFESRAITRYLSANKYKENASGSPDLLRSGDPAEAAAVEVWMEVEANEFHPVIAPLVSELLRKPKVMKMEPDEAVVEKHAGDLEKVLDVYEARLSKSKYLAGDFFSLADLHHLPYTHFLLQSSKASLIKSRSHVKAWWEDISSSPCACFVHCFSLRY